MSTNTSKGNNRLFVVETCCVKPSKNDEADGTVQDGAVGRQFLGE